MLSLSGGIYLGWALGGNDAANVFGTAVGSRIIRMRDATILCAVAVLLGALLEGGAGIETLRGLTHQTHATLAIVTFSAAFTVTLMTLFRLPISTSQAVVGAILGVGLATDSVNTASLTKVVLCWVATPLGSMLLAILLYKLVGWLLRVVPIGILLRDRLLFSGLVLVGTYGSYALGANNVANVTGIFSGQLPGVSDQLLTLIGGIAIALGLLTFSGRVMKNVGTGVMTLDAFTAFIAVSAMAATVHIFAIVGVPVSTSQGIIGALLGIGILRGKHTVHFREVGHIATGWILTPATALLLAAAGYAIFA